MKSMGRLLLVAVPILAVVTFFFVMKKWGGIAPQPPVAEMTADIDLVPATRTAARQPTVLAPQPVTESTLPPGTTASEYENSEIPADDDPPLLELLGDPENETPDPHPDRLLPVLPPLQPPFN